MSNEEIRELEYEKYLKKEKIIYLKDDIDGIEKKIKELEEDDI